MQSIAILWYCNITKYCNKYCKISKYCNTYCKFFKYCKKYCKIFKYCQKYCKTFQVLQKVLQKKLIIVKSIEIYESIAKSIAKFKSIAKSIAKFRVAEQNFICGILYWILIGNNYFYIIHLSLIYLHFFVINSLWWIKLFPYIICWIQKLCLLYNFFDEYNYIKLKCYLKMLIDQCMMWCFFVVYRDMG